MSSSCNSCSLKQNNCSSQNQPGCNSNNTLLTTMTNTNSLLTSSSYLNESNKFCSWGSNSSSNTNSFENNNCASSIEGKLNWINNKNCQKNLAIILSADPKAFSRQNRGGSSHHFAYPSITNHLQTLCSTNGQIPNNDAKNIQLARPVTALVFSQTSSLPTNLLPLNIQHQQIGNQQHPSVPSLISPASLSHLHLLERQMFVVFLKLTIKFKLFFLIYIFFFFFQMVSWKNYKKECGKTFGKPTNW